MSLTWEQKLHNTEQKQEDRRHALEKMGISVQSSGIKVDIEQETFSGDWSSGIKVDKEQETFSGDRVVVSR